MGNIVLILLVLAKFIALGAVCFTLGLVLFAFVEGF